MWQDVKSELRDVCTSQPQPLGKKYLFSWAARSKLLWATHRGVGVTLFSINFNLTLRKGNSWKALLRMWSIRLKEIATNLLESCVYNSEIKWSDCFYSPHIQWYWVMCVCIKWKTIICMEAQFCQEKKKNTWNGRNDKKYKYSRWVNILWDAMF